MGALLDELMGADRNLTDEERRGFKEIKWDDREVCAFYMVGFCPHDLFVNTPSDLGACSRIHDPKLKENFANSPRHDSYVPKFKAELAQFCEKLVNDLDRKVRHERERLAQEVEPPSLSAEKAEQLSVLEEKINNLLEQVEALGEEGKVDEAEALMKKVEALNAEKTVLVQRPADKEKKMALCEICGSFLVASDSVEMIQSHVLGKQHVGYGLVRDFLADQKAAKDKGKEEERVGRGKEADGNRKPREKESESKRSGSNDRERYRDLGPFSDEKFDAKRWVNSSCQSRHPQVSLEKHLVDLEIKLQIASEEIGASLEEQSGGALLRVPRATRDVLRLRDDAVSLRGSVAGILQKLKKAEGSSAECIATLARVDSVKQRMEAAYKTLQDAAGLTQLSSTVEDVFASGDLPRVAETLASMRNCLSAVGEVAEFANVRKQLEVLEDRLEAMVQPRLTDALTYHKVDVAQDLRGILIRIGRFKSLELQYSKVRLKPIKQLWEDFDTKKRANKLGSERTERQRLPSEDEFQYTSPQTSFASWLPSFYDELLLYLEQEWKWCMIAFPDDYMTLVPKLVVETMGVLGVSFVSRLNLATGDAVPETKALAKGVMDLLSGDLPKGINIQTKHLEALIELHNVTGSFARNIQHLFAESELRVLIDTLKAVYSPFESFKQKYGNMERAILSSEIAVVDLRAAVTRGVGAQGIELSETVRRMEESIPQVVVLLEAAVERCIGFTGGSEADELILALDDIMLQYISMLQETLKSLRVVCGVDGTGDGVGSKKDASAEKRESSRKMDLTSNEEWSIVQGALQILTVADCLTSRSSVFEASLRATLARLNSSLSISLFGTNLDHNLSHLTSDQSAGDLSMAGRASLDVAAIRLVDVPEKAQKLLNLLEQSKDPRFHALPLASQRVAAFADTVNELVYDVLISKVRQRLGEVSLLPIWSSVEEKTAFPLPNFSSYPQSYVTSVGEYLLTLPQQLEPLAEGISTNGDSNNEDAQFFATEWMFKVAEGATALYIEQLRGIQYISDRGAQQLSVDIEYLSNVLSALSMPIPHVLATFQTCLATPRDHLKDVMKSEAGSELDFPTANLVCKMRRISFD